MDNYFDHQEAAKRYKTGRPNFHFIVVEKIKLHLSLKNKLGLCLDVACGTGLLSEALLAISEKVIGIDNSEGMLSQANKNNNINYLLGQAENLSIVNGLVDLITVSSAFHWFNQAAFLKSSFTKLNVGSYIVIHNSFFTSRTEDEFSDSYKSWMIEVYLKKFISPKRNQKSVSQSEILSIGFEIIGDEKFENIVAFDKQGLVNYLVTQSNVISNVEQGQYSIEEVKQWLNKELTAHFEHKETRNFIFGNHLVFLQKV